MIVLSISGFTLLIAFAILGGWYGWWKGIRAFLTITLATVLAYLMFVGGAGTILNYIDHLYRNIPRLVTLVLGNDPASVAPFDPLFTSQLQLPLPVRLILFIIFVALGWIFNKQPWTEPGPTKDPLQKQLGLFTGALTALLWISAATRFWQQFIAENGNQGGPVSDFLGAMPDMAVLMPWLIIFFFLIVFASILTRLPRLWQAK